MTIKVSQTLLNTTQNIIRHCVKIENWSCLLYQTPKIPKEQFCPGLGMKQSHLSNIKENTQTILYQESYDGEEEEEEAGIADNILFIWI